MATQQSTPRPRGASVNPFTDSHILKPWADKRDPAYLTILGRHLVERDVRHLSNSQLAAAIKRDMVRARAKAAL